MLLFCVFILAFIFFILYGFLCRYSISWMDWKCLFSCLHIYQNLQYNLMDFVRNIDALCQIQVIVVYLEKHFSDKCVNELLQITKYYKLFCKFRKKYATEIKMFCHGNKHPFGNCLLMLSKRFTITMIFSTITFFWLHLHAITSLILIRSNRKYK